MSFPDGAWTDVAGTRTLQTLRLVLTPLEVSDAAEMAEVLADARIYEFIGGEPESVATLTARYDRQVVGRSPDGAQLWFNWIARTADDPLAIGFVQATVTVENAELAWVLAPLVQGQGFATEATAAVVDWLRSEGCRHFIAHIHPEHDSSVRVAQRLGFHVTTTMCDGEVRWEMSDED
jgi:RimJ/RimL family protein N-acetyltransferase